MRLARALGPIGVAALREKYWGKRSVVVTSNGENRLADLVTIEEVETRLNDGCASLVNLSVIDHGGTKLPRERLYQRQAGPAWSPEFLKKTELHALLAEGRSFVLHNMTHVNARVAELVADIEANFPEFAADVHLYVSPRASSTGYRVHKDEPQHKIYLQVLGTTEWTVYRGTHAKRALTDDEARACLEVDFRATLTPGSVLYMPPGVFHHATNPSGPRLSVSIPIAPRIGVLPVDRHHVPLTELMREHEAPA